MKEEKIERKEKTGEKLGIGLMSPQNEPFIHFLKPIPLLSVTADKKLSALQGLHTQYLG